MKTNRTSIFSALMVALVFTIVGVAQIDAQGPNPRAPRANLGTAFTYQGQLKDNNTLANGAYDFEFRLFDALAGGNQVGSLISVGDATVMNGYFTVSLDFGASAFNGDARFLEIRVRPGASTGAYTPLVPRQTITPAPMALALPGFYTQQNATSPNIIGGHSSNTVTSGVDGATISGGGRSGFHNRVTDNYGVVGGGMNNQAGDNNGDPTNSGAATIGGGTNNTASGLVATIGGGTNNTASGAVATIGGGELNTASGSRATIAGGSLNLASGNGAFIGGGGFDGTTFASNQARGNASTIGGGLGNVITTTAHYAMIGGGFFNSANGMGSTIGGGVSNTANNRAATISGGNGNTAVGTASFVGGGGIGIVGNTTSFCGNDVQANSAAIVGGWCNLIPVTGTNAFIGGGNNNTASGNNSTIPGGLSNSATMSYTLAAGRRAKANHDGAFVWGDSTNADFASTANNQFLIRANGGVGINTTSPIANALTVKNQVVSGGDTATNDPEAFVSQGNRSGISMDDRDGVNSRWVIYPNGAALNFYKAGPGNLVTINSSGKVQADGGFNGQCLSNASNVFNTNATRTCNMDFAEAFGALERTAPGELVSLVAGNHTTPTVAKTRRGYDDLLVGVVSQNPGLVFDNGATHIAGDNSQLITNDKTVVALVGRVNVKVSVENGAIALGDPLTSSSQPGVAMKATRAGKIIGYAMEAAHADGIVLALVQPGYFAPSAESETSQLDARAMVALEARLTALEHNAQTNLVIGLIGGALLSGVVMMRRKRVSN